MKSAFTLVEVLVVLAIVGVLAAIGIPAYKNAQTRAKEAVATSNLRQIGSALLAYAGENNQRLPLANTDIPYTTDPLATIIPWQQQVDEYVGKDRRVFLFPNAPLANSEIKPLNRIRGFFLGARAAYLENPDEFGPVSLSKIRSASAYILGGEVRYGPFSSQDADRDNYSMDPAFAGRTTPGEPANLLFADGSVRRYTHFDQTQMTTSYDGPGLEAPEW